MDHRRRSNDRSTEAGPVNVETNTDESVDIAVYVPSRVREMSIVREWQVGRAGGRLVQGSRSSADIDDRERSAYGSGSLVVRGTYIPLLHSVAESKTLLTNTDVETQMRRKNKDKIDVIWRGIWKRKRSVWRS